MMISEALSASFSTFVLIALAEVGDKSQLVCMALAARHRALPVIVGAGVAFLLLNALAVLFGAGVAALLPAQIMLVLVAVLFAAFGLHALTDTSADGADDVPERPGRSIFFTTALLIFLAEFGDKTQLAVAGLAVTLPPWSVWLGASVALLTISVLGVWAGRTILRRMPLNWLRRTSGALFLLFAALAAWRAAVI